MSFLKFTAQQIKFRLTDNNDPRLNIYRVDAKDRQFQFWERNSLSIDLWSSPVFDQKLDYIHNNPLQEKWRLVAEAKDYKYSSARYYETGIDDFDLITHYAG